MLASLVPTSELPVWRFHTDLRICNCLILSPSIVLFQQSRYLLSPKPNHERTELLRCTLARTGHHWMLARILQMRVERVPPGFFRQNPIHETSVSTPDQCATEIWWCNWKCQCQGHSPQDRACNHVKYGVVFCWVSSNLRHLRCSRVVLLQNITCDLACHSRLLSFSEIFYNHTHQKCEESPESSVKC